MSGIIKLRKFRFIFTYLVLSYHLIYGKYYQTRFDVEKIFSLYYDHVHNMKTLSVKNWIIVYLIHLWLLLSYYQVAHHQQLVIKRLLCQTDTYWQND